MACVSLLALLSKHPLFSKMLIPAGPFPGRVGRVTGDAVCCHGACCLQSKSSSPGGSPKMGFLSVPESLYRKVPPSLPLPMDCFYRTWTPGRYKACQKGHSHQTWLSASSSAFVWLWYSPLAENPVEKKREALQEASTFPTSVASPLLGLPRELSAAGAPVGLFRGQNISL